MNYVWLVIGILMLVYTAIGVDRAMRIMKAVSQDLKPKNDLERFALILIGIFHAIAWLPYYIAGYVEWRKKYGNSRL